MIADPASLTASQARQLLQSGELSVAALADACLRRIEERDSAVRAWCHLDPDLVRARARDLDRSDVRGPLFGIPVAVKDVILTDDMPTRYNSSIYQNYHPRMDASCVKILRAAGALIFGKTDTVEFAATGRKALTRNPHNLAHTPGGSSSGSAAAVADFQVPLALGTQTGGSTIRPASYCGTWAVKPTWNLVSAEGAKQFSTSLDTMGWFARSAEDLELLYSVLAPGWESAPSLSVRNARIAVYRTPVWDQALDGTRNAIDQAILMLETAGARVEELDLPGPFSDLPEAHLTIMRTEARTAFMADQRSHPEQLDSEIQLYVDNAWNHTTEQLLSATNTAATCRAVFDKLAAAYDAVLAPSSLGEAPEGLSETGRLTFNGLWTLLHAPCVNVPGLVGAAGLPVGITVTGPRFSDAKVLAAAQAIGAVFTSPACASL